MITELLTTRFSVRQYEDRPIPADVLQDMLAAGRLSPSGGNEQPWMFGVITQKELITQIAGAACQQNWLARAPLLIVLCVTPVEDARGGRDIQIERYPEYAEAIRGLDAGLYWALNQEEHQTKIAGTHIALAALEHGVGCCWVSRFVVSQVALLLKLPAGVIPTEILAFGYPSEKHRSPRKKPLEEIVFYDRFQKS